MCIQREREREKERSRERDIKKERGREMQKEGESVCVRERKSLCKKRERKGGDREPGRLLAEEEHAGFQKRLVVPLLRCLPPPRQSVRKGCQKSIFPWALWLSKVITAFKGGFEAIYPFHHSGVATLRVRSKNLF